MANSMKCQPIPPQARSRARRTRRSRSSLTLSGAALTLSSLAIGKAYPDARWASGLNGARRGTNGAVEHAIDPLNAPPVVVGESGASRLLRSLLSSRCSRYKSSPGGVAAASPEKHCPGRSTRAPQKDEGPPTILRRAALLFALV
jgi:hypothetical protein